MGIYINELAAILKKHYDRQMEIRNKINEQNAEIDRNKYEFDKLCAYILNPLFDTLKSEITPDFFPNYIFNKLEKGYVHHILSAYFSLKIKNALPNEKHDFIKFEFQEKPISILYSDSTSESIQTFKVEELTEEKIKEIVTKSLKDIFNQY